jgi:predicted nucleotidyltransferase
MDKRTDIIDKVKAYKDLVITAFPINIDQCWLYGSYAKGTPCEHSDIDIALVVNHIEDNDYWASIKLLWKLTYRIDDRIEPVLISRDTDYAGFLDEIQRTGIEITN